MAERFQQRCAFDGDFHFSIRPLAWKSPKGGKEVGGGLRFSQGRRRRATAVTNGFGRGPALPFLRERGKKVAGKAIHRSGNRRTPSTSAVATLQARRTRSLLQLPLEQFDLFGHRGIGAHEVLDLAYRVQHRGVVATAEAPPDLRPRAQQ